MLEGVKPDHVAAMQEDPTASHVLEVAIAASGNVPGLLEELSQRFFLAGGEGEGAEAGRKLRVAALHPHANFVVQALLAACTTPAQVRGSGQATLPPYPLSSRTGSWVRPSGPSVAPCTPPAHRSLPVLNPPPPYGR